MFEELEILFIYVGVEDVITDCKSHKVVVKGEKADPLKVLERVQKKSHRKVELLSPIPKPAAEEAKKPEEKEIVKPEEKKEEVYLINLISSFFFFFFLIFTRVFVSFYDTFIFLSLVFFLSAFLFVF